MKTTTTMIVSVLLMLAGTSVAAQWSVQSQGIPGYFRVDAVLFIDDQTGFAGGTNGLFGGDGILSRTSDGGASWSTVLTASGAPIQDIHFVDADLGFAVGVQGLIAKTTDGGRTWGMQNFTDGFGSKEPLRSVYFVNASLGFAGGGFNAQWVLKTNDGGENWQRLSLPDNAFQRINSVFFTSADYGFAVGGDPFSGGFGKIYHTTNGGQDWDVLDSDVESYFDDVYFTNANTGFIGGWDGLLLKTSDGGQSWHQQNVNTPEPGEIRQFSFVNHQLGYACTLRGKILKTSDGGSNWNLDGGDPSRIASLYSISVPSTAFGIAVGLGGIYLEKQQETHVAELVRNTGRLRLYPNPTQGNFTIEQQVDQHSEARFTIIDMHGKHISSGTLAPGAQVHNAGNELKNGVYIVLLETNRDVVSEKLVVAGK